MDEFNNFPLQNNEDTGPFSDVSIEQTAEQSDYAARLFNYLRSPEDEKTVLLSMLRDCEAITGPFDIQEVEGCGWEIRLGQNEPQRQENGYLWAGADWVFYDLDDSTVAYSGAKDARQQEYNKYLQSTGLTVDESVAKRLMDMTDRFSRWDDRGSNMYHIGAHMEALAWATSVLRAQSPEQPDSEQILADLQASFDRMGAARQNGEGLTDADPFYMQDGRLLIRAGVTEDEAIAQVFLPMIDLPQYDAVADSMRELKTQASRPVPEVGVFTLGEPIFQLFKELWWMQQAQAQGRPLPISRILLTTVHKGDFLSKMASDASKSGENSSEYFNAIRPHTILLLDDDPSQLTSFEEWNHRVMTHSQTAIAALRLRHDPAAKTANRPWLDNPERTQVFSRPTYETDEADSLLEKILWALDQSNQEATLRAPHGHPEYYDDNGYFVLVPQQKD